MLELMDEQQRQGLAVFRERDPHRAKGLPGGGADVPPVRSRRQRHDRGQARPSPAA